MLTLYVVVAWAGKAETFCNNVSLFLSSSYLGKMAHNRRTILRHLSRSTAVAHILGHKYRILGHSLLCSTYETKNGFGKNMAFF